MSTFDENEFKKRKAEFYNEYKKVEPYESRRELTKNTDLISTYKTNLIETYNRCSSYLLYFAKTADSAQRLTLLDKISPLFTLLKRGFENIQLDYEWPKSPLCILDINKVTELSTQEPQAQPEGAVGGSTESTRSEKEVIKIRSNRFSRRTTQPLNRASISQIICLI